MGTLLALIQLFVAFSQTHHQTLITILNTSSISKGLQGQMNLLNFQQKVTGLD